MRNMLNHFGTIGTSTVRLIVTLNLRGSIMRSVYTRLAHCLCLYRTQHLGNLCLTLRHWPIAMSGLKPCMAARSVISEQRRRRPIIVRRPLGS